jgi:hypothetical protein
MSTQETLAEFSGHVDAFEGHRTFIDRARSQSEKFSSAVIEKVVLEHEIQCAELVDKILPLVATLDEAIVGLQTELGGIVAGQSGATEAMEELSLRQMIGELDDDGFEAASKDLKEELGASGEKVDTLEVEITDLSAALDRWSQLAEAAGQDSGRAEVEVDVAEEDEAELEVEPEAVAELDLADEASDEEELAPPGFDDTSDEEDDAVELAVEFDEADEDAAEPVEVAFDGADGDDAADGDAADGDDVENGVDEDQRRALVIYQEGTTEEQFYPFTADVLTIGRGRDNDVQIKNDSKVSRYHCRIFRRNAHFFVEDNKSSNGTLVNGELVTERRLFGGEEIIIGETFFRFRIMD